MFTRKCAVNDEGFVLVTVLCICFLAAVIVASMTALTISDLVSTARNRAVIEARNSAESSMDTLYAVVNRNNSDDLLTAASREFLADDGTSPISTSLENTHSSGGIYNTSLVVTQEYQWSAKYYSVDDDGGLHECGILTSETDDDSRPCFKMRISKIVTNPFGNSGGLQSISSGSTESDYQNANNTRTEYVIDIVVRHMCTQTDDVDNPTGCVWSRYQQKIRKRDFIQHAVMSQTEEVAPQVYELVSNVELQDRVRNLDNAYAANDTVTGNIHTNDAHVYVCDGFNVTQGTGLRNWITSGYDSASSPGSVTAAAASAGSNFSACNGSSGVTVPRFTAARSKFSLPSRIGDDNGLRLTSIASSDDPIRYVLNGTTIRVNFRYDQSDPVPENRDRTGMMNPIVDGDDLGWYPLPSNGVLSVNPDNGNGAVTVSGQIKGKLTIFSTGSIRVANSLTYVDQSLSNDLLGLYASKDIILNCYNDASPQSGQCDNKQVDGLLWAAKQTVVESASTPGVFDISYQGTMYNDHWNDSSVSNLDNPPVLRVNGGAVTYHRGTFGAIESIGSGRVTSGWKKEFVWDARLASAQPPYMLRDALATYIRSGARDIPCDDECS